MEGRLHHQAGHRPADPHYLDLNRVGVWASQDNPPDQTAQQGFLVGRGEATAGPERGQARPQIAQLRLECGIKGWGARRVRKALQRLRGFRPGVQGHLPLALEFRGHQPVVRID